MSESKVITLFKESTEMYCQGNYQACLALITDCLTLQSQRSVLYSNRAIVNYHLKQLHQSFQDLRQAIRKNHLNYVAYFNLFTLHFLNQNNVQAFQNLCLCLSSAYTVLCKMSPSLQWIQQSIYYSFNNKESLLIKAILLYQKSQLTASIQLLQQTIELQVLKNNKEGILKHIHSIESQLGMPLTNYQCLPNGTQYVLKTNVPYPQQDLFEEQLSKLLKEFNQVYRLINEEMQMQHQFKGQVSSNSASQLKSQIDQKQINQAATAYNSIAFSRTVQAEDQNGTHLNNQKELKLLSFIGDNNNKTLIQEPSISQGNLQPISQIYSKIQFYIEQVQIYQSNKQDFKLDNLYAVLSYGQDNKILHRTSTIKKMDGGLKWCQLTNQLTLTFQADLKVKILRKKYTSFKDDLIGSATIRINKNGYLIIPLNKQSQCIGVFKMRADYV